MRRWPFALALVAAVVAAPAVASAHPLGNLAVNTAARLEVAPDHVVVRYTLDLAELPALQARQHLAADPDHVTAAEASTYRARQCTTLAGGLHLVVDGRPSPLTVVDSSFALPPGQGGLTTLRLSCTLQASAGRVRAVGLTDTNLTDRIGWREITAVGDRMSIDTSDVPATSLSDQLRAYPSGVTPARVLHATLMAKPGGPALDATSASTAAAIATQPQARGADRLTRAVGDLVGNRHLGLGLGLLAVLGATLLGAMHALAPGHGKSLMAATVVGRQGTLRQVLAIGLTVAATHTSGVLILGMLIWASKVIAPDRLLPWLTVASGGLIVLTGVALVARARRGGGPMHAHGPGHVHTHGIGHGHTRAGNHHPHDDHDHDHADRPGAAPPSTRWLVAMGVAGGLVPTPSALVVLLGATALGRAWFGVLLVAVYGVGMSATLMGAGLLLVRLQRWLERRWWERAWLATTLRIAPVLTALVLCTGGLAIVARGAAQL